jgi:hypothetical protein
VSGCRSQSKRTARPWLTVFFRRQVGRGSLRRLSKSDRSMPIVAETERILNRRNSLLKSRAQTFDVSWSRFLTTRGKNCDARSTRYHDRKSSSGSEGAYRRIVGDRGVCLEFCVRGRVDHHAVTNLSSNMMANWVFASHHSCGGIFHFPATWRKTRYNNFIAASSVGKWPLVLTARRSFAFKASMAFVV